MCVACCALHSTACVLCRKRSGQCTVSDSCGAALHKSSTIYDVHLAYLGISGTESIARCAYDVEHDVGTRSLVVPYRFQMFTCSNFAACLMVRLPVMTCSWSSRACLGGLKMWAANQYSLKACWHRWLLCNSRSGYSCISMHACLSCMCCCQVCIWVGLALRSGSV